LAVTRNKSIRDGEKSSGQNHLFNIETIKAMDSTSGQAELIAQGFLKKSTTEYNVYCAEKRVAIGGHRFKDFELNLLSGLRFS
jgi:hypothetical protein